MRVTIEWDMLKLPRRSVVAIEAMVHVALAGLGRTVPTAEIADAINVTKRGLEPILQQLVRSGLLTSLRGPQGGYELARERSKISVLAIVDAALDPETAPSEDRASPYEKVLAKLESETEKQLRAALSDYALEDLCKEVRESGVKVHVDKAFDYAI